MRENDHDANKYQRRLDSPKNRRTFATMVVLAGSVLLFMVALPGSSSSSSAAAVDDAATNEFGGGGGLRTAPAMEGGGPTAAAASGAAADGAYADADAVDDCVIRPAEVPPHPVQSTFTASYPGSGAKMTWNLIEALTGYVTGDDFNLNGHDNVVSIKTHYPSDQGKMIDGAENVQRAILLLRHPLDAIPSYFNYIYEIENNLPGHSTRAPLESWMSWRDSHFEKELTVWKKHTDYWMERYKPLRRIVVSYEKLIAENTGPNEATRIAEFISRSDGVTVRPPNEILCVWDKVVNYKKRASGGGGGKMRVRGRRGMRRLQEAGVVPPPASGGDVAGQIVAEAEKAAEEKAEAEAQAAKEEAMQDAPPESSEGLSQRPAGAKDVPPAEAAAQAAEGEGPPLPPASQQQGGNGEPNPASPESKRAGPKYVPPYTAAQRRATIDALSRLLEKYRDENALSSILVGYIDEVERRGREQDEAEKAAAASTDQAQAPGAGRVRF